MQNPNSNNLTLAQKGPMQSINYDQILYHINYVKNWAFLLSEWINLQQLGPNNNGKSPEDSHEIEMGIDTPNCETQKLDKFFNQVVLNTNFFKLLNDNNNILTCYYILCILYNNKNNNIVVCINYELQIIEENKYA